LSYLPGTLRRTSANAVRGAGTSAARNAEKASASRPFAGSIGMAWSWSDASPWKCCSANLSNWIFKGRLGPRDDAK
jgi:hypothetical protein